jgi:hypothetical protein
MKKTIIITTIFLSLLTARTSTAQDTIMNKEVEVIKAFQPTVSDANKIFTSPQINDTVKYTPVFDYKIQSTMVPVSRTIQKLPVVQLGNPPKTVSNTGYARAGFGNAITPYGEFVLNTSPSKSTDFGIQLSHFSSNPNVTLNNGIKVKSPYSDNSATIFLKNKFKKAELNWNIGYERNSFTYYGFPGVDTLVTRDSLLYRETENVSPTLNTKQIFNNASALFNLKKIDAKADFVYDVSLGYNYFWNFTGQKTHRGSYDGNYLINKRNFDIVIGSQINYFYQDSIQNLYKQKLNHQFVFAGISPQYVYQKRNLLLKAGFNLSTIIDNDTSAIFHFSPKIYFEYEPIKNMLTLFAGTDGKLSSNDYQTMTLVNRYLSYNTEVKPSQEVINLYGGFKGKFSRNISYLFDVAYAVKSDEPFFYLTQTNYPLASDELRNLFAVKYFDLNILRFGGNMRYSSNNVTVGLKGNYYSYTTELNVILTHRPAYDAGVNTIFRINNRLQIRLDGTLMGPRQGEIEKRTFELVPGTELLAEPVISTEFQELKTIVDVNAGADYDYTKKLRFSLDILNLTNQRQEMWHGYSSQGILIMAGARYTF